MQVLEADQCETLRDHTETAAGEANKYQLLVKDELTTRYGNPKDPDKVDWERVSHLQQKADEFREVTADLAGAKQVGCGIGTYPVDAPESAEGDWDDVAEDLKEIDDEVAATLPKARVEDDIGFEEGVSQDFQKKHLTTKTADARESIDEVTDEDIDVDPRNPAGPQTIVCRYPDQERQEECIERRAEQMDAPRPGDI